MKSKTLASALAVLALAGTAAAQPPVVPNPSFEQDDPTGNTDPLGWFQFNGSLTVATKQHHTGDRSIKLSYGTSNFGGLSTAYADPNTLGYPYDPLIIWKGGPVTISGWYNIPTVNTLQNAGFTTLKLELRRTVNNSVYLSFEWPVFGDTGGQWTYFEHTITNADITTWPLEPTAGQPSRCSILALLFGPNGVDPTSAVYWDDINLTQQLTSTCYANCDNSTSAPILNANDFQCFLNEFAAGTSYANCDNSTSPPVLNANDFQCFLNAFATGCT